MKAFNLVVVLLMILSLLVVANGAELSESSTSLNINQVTENDISNTNEVMFVGTVDSISYSFSGTFYEVQIERILLDPTNQLTNNEFINVIFWFDSNSEVGTIEIGEKVEAFGEYEEENVRLITSSHYLKAPIQNHAPLISNIEVTPIDIEVGGTSEISVNAYDLDGDTLSYSYVVDEGSIVGNGNSAIWKAESTDSSIPILIGTYCVDVVVSDGKETVSDTVCINVNGISLQWENQNIQANFLDISDDGEYILVGNASQNGQVSLFDKQNNVLWEKQFTNPLNDIAISGDGSCLVIATEDTVFYYHDSVLTWTSAVDAQITSVDISQDGNNVAFTTEDKCFYFYDNTGFVWKHDTIAIPYSCSISKNGDYIVTGCDGSVYYFNNDGLIWESEINDFHVTDIDISDDGEYFAFVGWQGCYLFDKNQKIIWESDEDASVVKISGNGDYILTGDYSGKVCYYSKYLGIPLWIYETMDSVISVDMTDNGDFVVAGSIPNLSLHVLDSEKNLLFYYPKWITSTKISDDGKCIVIGSGSDGISDFKNFYDSVPNVAPKPNITSMIYSWDDWKEFESFSIYPQSTREIEFKIQNEGGTSNIGYFDISVSDGLDIINWNDDSSNGIQYDNIGPNSENIDGQIVCSDGTTKIADYELLSGCKPFMSNENTTVSITVKAIGEGEQWIKYRTCMLNEDEEFLRVPISGDIDQQGWYVYNKTIQIDGIQPDIVIPMEDEYVDWVSIGDLNNDGLNDIVVESGGVYYQQANHSFKFQDLGIGYGICICTGDMNNDGLIDLVMTDSKSYKEYIVVYYQQEDNSFNTLPDIEFEIDSDGDYCEVADLNNDNLNDILVSYVNSYPSNEGNTQIYYQNVDGTFGEPNIIDFLFGSKISINDVNGDNLKDIVGPRSFSVVVSYQQTDNTFNNDLSGIGTLAPDMIFMEMADIDSDLEDDIIYSDWQYPYTTFVSKFFNGNRYLGTGHSVECMDVNDLNNDGNNDIAILYDDFFNEKGFIGVYYQKYTMDIDILSPSEDFFVYKNTDIPISVKISYDGKPIEGAGLVKAKFNNGDSEVVLSGGENGIYTGNWTPQNVIEGQIETPVEITIEAAHGTLKKSYAKIDGYIVGELNLNLEYDAPTNEFDVNKHIPQLIRVKVTDDKDQAVPGYLMSKVESSFSNGDTSIELYDDGMHYDKDPNDGIYANVWIPENVETENVVDIEIETKALSKIGYEITEFINVRLHPEDFIIVDEVSVYGYDSLKSSNITVYYKASDECVDEYNLFVELDRTNFNNIEYLDYTVNSFGQLDISIPEDVDYFKEEREVKALNWNEFKDKKTQEIESLHELSIPQYLEYMNDYEDITIGIRKSSSLDETGTASILSFIYGILDILGCFGAEQISFFFGVGGYILEVSEDSIFSNADLIIGQESLYSEFNQHNIRDTVTQNWLDENNEYASIVSITPLKFNELGTKEIVIQLFADLDKKDILYNKKLCLDPLGTSDESINLEEPNWNWNNIDLKEGFELLDSEIIYGSVMGNDPKTTTAVSLSRKVDKNDNRKQILFIEISRKTNPEEEYQNVEERSEEDYRSIGERLFGTFPYNTKQAQYREYLTDYYCNLRDISFQISVDEHTDVIYNQIREYEIGDRYFRDYLLFPYDVMPDGDQLTYDKNDFIPQFFEYTDSVLYTEHESGLHHNFYQKYPSVSEYENNMAKKKLILSCFPYVGILGPIDDVLGIIADYISTDKDLAGDMQIFEELFDLNERDLLIKHYLHERSKDDFESIVLIVPIILDDSDSSTDIFITAPFTVYDKDALYSKKITLDKNYVKTHDDPKFKMEFILECPANLHVYDKDGNHIGLNSDGTVECDMPDAYYSGANSGREVITIFGDSQVTCEVDGYDNGKFNLTMLGQSTNGDISVTKYTNVPLEQNTVAVVEVDYNQNLPNLMEIDSDGDGIFDYSQEASSTENMILPSIIYVPSDYSSIQEAIDYSQNNDTIYVSSGLYNESIIVNKSIIIMGENKNNTIISCFLEKDGVCVNTDRVSITGFTIQNCTTGIFLDSVSECQIYDNTIVDNGIGVMLNNSEYNFIIHNNFIGNLIQAADSGENIWNDEYPSGGNYWSDYYGGDNYGGSNQNLTGPDGIGDSSYYILYNSEDKYPFVNQNGWFVLDESENVEDDSDDVSTSTTTSSSGGGGGGGGGGTTGEEFENIAYKDVLSEFVSKGDLTSYEFDSELNVIEYIRFEAFRNWGQISSTIEMLHGTSAMVDEDAPDTVYCNVNLWVGKSGFSSSDNIDSPVVGFKVEKNWVEENEIDDGTIRLCRYSDGKWSELDTQKLSEDDTYLHFEASTPGFSPFAIVGHSIEQVTEKQVEDVESLESTVDSNIAEETDISTEPKRIFSNWMAIGSLSILLIGGIVGYTMYRKRS